MQYYKTNRPGSKPSCIDNIISNENDSVLLTGTLSDNISHHLPVFSSQVNKAANLRTRFGGNGAWYRVAFGNPDCSALPRLAFIYRMSVSLHDARFFRIALLLAESAIFPDLSFLGSVLV